MKRVAVAAALVLGLGLAYVAAHLALIEVGREVVVLHKWAAAGEVRRARLWLVDEGRYSWLHHGDANSEWIRRLASDAIVTVERGGRARPYRAIPDPQSHQRVHQLLREKYGIADRWVRFLTGGTERCLALPVRLEPVGDRF
ncbi:MAG: hypothetical protein HY699_18975 [Deltaproteobacteria bacterium]|nr:hypothetical protein [Deltaproteobacteria bacterium]